MLTLRSVILLSYNMYDKISLTLVLASTSKIIYLTFLGDALGLPITITPILYIKTVLFSKL